VREESAGTVVFYRDGDGSLVLFLLIQRGEPFNDWVFPKGHIEDGEDIESAALRETREETGLDVVILRKIRSYSYSFYWDPANERSTKTVHYFLARSDSNQPTSTNHGGPKSEAAAFKQIRFVGTEEAVHLVKHQIEKDMLREAEKTIMDSGI
jgi:8-oxo-dGTP pyrophosphatase MutT (NUDIX family)